MRRKRKVRMRHRKRAVEDATGDNADWNAPQANWTDNGDVWVNVAPADEATTTALSRREYDADWVAVDRRGRLNVNDGDRLVDIDADGAEVLVLEVTKVLPYGRQNIIFLEEKGRNQP